MLHLETFFFFFLFFWFVEFVIYGKMIDKCDINNSAQLLPLFLFFFFIYNENMRISLIKDHKHKALIEQSKILLKHYQHFPLIFFKFRAQNYFLLSYENIFHNNFPYLSLYH
jgi:hypothetical protein